MLFRSGVELPAKFKVSGDFLALSKANHMVGKFFKDLIAPIRVSVRHRTSVNISPAKAKMVTLFTLRGNDAYKFTQTVAVGQLAVHHNQQQIPAGEVLDPFVAVVTLYDAVKNSLWQKIDELTEYILSVVHMSLCFLQAIMIQNEFKSTRAYLAHNYFIIN